MIARRGGESNPRIAVLQNRSLTTWLPRRKQSCRQPVTSAARTARIFLAQRLPAISRRSIECRKTETPPPPPRTLVKFFTIRLATFRRNLKFGFPKAAFFGMALTTHEFNAPDTVARTKQGAEELAGSDLLGEKLILNMGPSHPATHGVLRIVLELDGELITKATPDVGYLHRGDEKIAENMQYNQFVPYTDRLDYLAPLANNVAYALAVEKLMGWELPAARQGDPRDLLRAGPHLRPSARPRRLRHGCRRDDRLPLHLHRAGEALQSHRDHHRRALHHQLHPHRRPDPRPAGRLLPAQLRKFLDEFPPVLDETDNLLTRNRIFVDRTRDVGVISKETPSPTASPARTCAAPASITTCARSTPISTTRSTTSISPSARVGDCYDRYLVRLEEMRQSVRS